LKKLFRPYIPGFVRILLQVTRYFLSDEFLLAIPTVENGGNHTVAFTQSARTLEAHKACLQVTKALAGLGVRILIDEEFLKKVG